MDAARLDARLTKDLDIVLLAEALTPEFGRAFWIFVDAGGYQVQQEAAAPRRFYRFSKPANSAFPVMLELFSRLPDGICYTPLRTLTPIPFDESVVSLSAILLDDAYYAMLHLGVVRFEGLSWVNERVLIPLKMKVWLDLRQRKAAGHAVDEKDIFGRIKAEWQATIDALRAITGQRDLLETNPLLLSSMQNRYPYLDPLNHLQIELLRRHRAGPPWSDDARVQSGIHMTINGVAAGLRKKSRGGKSALAGRGLRRRQSAKCRHTPIHPSAT